MKIKDLNKFYDLILELQNELELQINEDFDADYIKALAASYTLQDYLAHKIAAKKDN